MISRKPLQAFWTRHPDAKDALAAWFCVVKAADWRSLADVRRTYPHADGVRTRSGETLTVFNICGNKYRLVVRIRYEYRLANVRYVLTHVEYDAGKWKE